MENTLRGGRVSGGKSHAIDRQLKLIALSVTPKNLYPNCRLFVLQGAFESYPDLAIRGNASYESVCEDKGPRIY